MDIAPPPPHPTLQQHFLSVARPKQTTVQAILNEGVKTE